jgi:hypothetical protein
MPQRELKQQPATTITFDLMERLRDAASHVDVDMARTAIMSCKDGVGPEDAPTVKIVAQAKRHVMRAVADDVTLDYRYRELALLMAAELVEIGWRDSVHNPANRAFENAAGSDGKPRLTVIQGDML